MRILFENGVPRGVSQALIARTVKEARDQGWDMLRNGELLDIGSLNEVAVQNDGAIV